LTKGQNENRMSVAFPVEGNSGMDRGDLADPIVFVVIIVRPPAPPSIFSPGGDERSDRRRPAPAAVAGGWVIQNGQGSWQ
jgi:hypothetical protein